MTPGSWKLGDDPVDDRPTFLAHALAMSLRHGPGPWPDEAGKLPDDPPPGERSIFAPGARDGIESFHRTPTSHPETADELADLLCALASAPPERDDLVRLHERFGDAPALTIADDLIRRLARRRPPRERIRLIGRHLAEHGTRRDAVKIGLVLVGACGDERDRDLLLLLGALEELSLFAVVALVRSQPDGQRAVYELARRVTGWGRVHAVERLRGCDDPEVKHWLLRYGFRDGIVHEYLAHAAATTGDLYQAMLAEEVDDALLDGAADILAALATGGPAEDLRDYPEAVPALHRLAVLLASGEATLGRLNALLTIRVFLREPGYDGPWTAGDLRARYEELLAEPRWNGLVLACLDDPGHAGFGLAAALAERLRLPVVPQLTAALEVRPLDAWTWLHALRVATASEAERLCLLAERLLPLAELANGPEERLLWGEGPDMALGLVVAQLDAFPGTGLPLLDVALRNRVTRTRIDAVAALEAWPRLPDEAVEWVRGAARAEPDEELRGRMAALVRDR